MIDAIVIKLRVGSYADSVMVDKVISTHPISVTVAEFDLTDTYSPEVVVDPDKVLQLMAPIAVYEMSTEKAMNLNVAGFNIVGHMKTVARDLLIDQGDDPDEWALTVKAEAYKFVCYAKYCGSENG